MDKSQQTFKSESKVFLIVKKISKHFEFKKNLNRSLLSFDLKNYIFLEKKFKLLFYFLFGI